MRERLTEMVESMSDMEIDDFTQKAAALLERRKRENIYAEVAARMPEAEYGRCLHWAIHGRDVLRSHGIRAIYQAGTVAWPYRDDDGVSDTHFGYEWQPGTVWTPGPHLPEIHIWLGIPSTQEVVDFSTGDLPGQCKVLLGKDWTAEKPPMFFWSNECPQGVKYEPCEEATVFALKLAIREGETGCRTKMIF